MCTDAPVPRPPAAYETSGQNAEGTTFVEGLAPCRGRWRRDYGTADSRVEVTVWDPRGAPPGR